MSFSHVTSEASASTFRVTFDCLTSGCIENNRVVLPMYGGVLLPTTPIIIIRKRQYKYASAIIDMSIMEFAFICRLNDDKRNRLRYKVRNCMADPKRFRISMVNIHRSSMDLLEVFSLRILATWNIWYLYEFNLCRCAVCYNGSVLFAGIRGKV